MSDKAPHKSAAGVEVVTMRNAFYRDGYRATQALMVLLGFALLGSVWMNVKLLTREAPPPKYFATRPDGTTVPMTALDDPILNTSQLTNWVAKSVAKALTLDAKNYVGQVNENSSIFTYEGFEQYKAALQDSGTLELIKKKVMITSAAITSPPVIVDTLRTADGVLFWKIQVPMTVGYASAKDSYTQQLIVNLVVTRVPTTERVDGVAISQFVTKPRS